VGEDRSQEKTQRNYLNNLILNISQAIAKILGAKTLDLR
jgi:hypothetical protein